MKNQNCKKAYEYFKRTANYILDESSSQSIDFQADRDKVSLCSSFLCGNTSGGKYTFQDNGQTGIVESKFQQWLSQYPYYSEAIPHGVLVNLLHILAGKSDKHGEVAFTSSESDWYDTHESFVEVRDFAKSELKKMGNPALCIDDFDWLE